MYDVRTKTFAASSLLAVAALIASSYAGPGAGGWPMWAALCVCIVVFAGGFPRLIGLPAPLPLGIVIALAGIGSATTAAVAPMPVPLQWMGAFCAVGVVLVFLTQLLRGTGESQRLESTLGGCVGVLIAVFGSGWVGADRLAPNAADGSMMLLSGLSLAAAVLVSSLRWPTRITAPLGLVAAILVGGIASAVSADVTVVPGIVVGAVVGVVVVCLRVMLVSEASALRGSAITAAAPGVPGTPTDHPVVEAAPGNPVLDPWGAIAGGVAAVIASGALVYYTERLLLH